VARFDDEHFIVMATRRGQVVKNNLSLYGNPRKAGIKAINIADDDELIEVRLTNGDNEILLATRAGMAVRFHESKVRPSGRFTAGVRGISLAPGDEVIAMVAATADTAILTVCERGFGKRTKLSEYRQTNRGGKGVINIRASERNGPVVGMLVVLDEDQILAITEGGATIRYNVSDLREMQRATQGAKIIDVAPGDKLSSIARIEREDEDNGEEYEEMESDDAGAGPEGEATE